MGTGSCPPPGVAHPATRGELLVASKVTVEVHRYIDTQTCEQHRSAALGIATEDGLKDDVNGHVSEESCAHETPPPVSGQPSGEEYDRAIHRESMKHDDLHWVVGSMKISP